MPAMVNCCWLHMKQFQVKSFNGWMNKCINHWSLVTLQLFFWLAKESCQSVFPAFCWWINDQSGHCDTFLVHVLRTSPLEFCWTSRHTDTPNSSGFPRLVKLLALSQDLLHNLIFPFFSPVSLSRCSVTWFLLQSCGQTSLSLLLKKQNKKTTLSAWCRFHRNVKIKVTVRWFWAFSGNNSATAECEIGSW